MTLFVIGLGLFDEKDITLRALEAVKSSERVYLEAYTSILMVEDYQERLVRVKLRADLSSALSMCVAHRK